MISVVVVLAGLVASSFATSNGTIFDLHARVNQPTPNGVFGAISTDSPYGLAGGTVKTDNPPISSFFAGLNPPFPTNSWWAPYASSPGTGTAAGPFPYESALDGYGVIFGISTNRQWDGTSIKQPTQTDWRISFTQHSGTFANHKATAYDTQSVTLSYFTGSSTMTAYLVPGSPYLTFQFSGATPLFTSLNGGISSFNGQSLSSGASSTATGTQFTVTNTAGTTYLIYALSSISLKATATSSTAGTIQATGAYTGVLRVVMLSQSSHKALLDQYYQNYPTSVGIDYSFTTTTGTLIFNWNVVGNGANLLMLTWPHHRTTLQSPNFPATSSLSYLTTKGYMYPALGSQWKMLYQLTSSWWNPPRAADSSCSSTIIQGLQYEISQLNVSNAPIPGDFYYWGGALAAAGRLALIADSMGRSDLVTPVVNYLKASMQNWFSSSAPTLAAYETTWGGVVNKAAATNVNIDFGNGYYNDHHFHYGYFLTVAAIIAKYDGNWLSQHKSYINWFARDIINPSTQDPYFPVTRCRDFFAGHSWASGIANGAGSRDEESSGEAVNAYYGALLWASTSLSQDYVNYARLLLASEQQAAQTYWHLYPSQSSTARDNPYPEASVRNLITIGNVQDWQSGAWLFWGDQKSEIAAIQILPLTPVNEYLYDAPWVQNVWSYTMPELVDPSIGDSWKSLIVAAYSNSNPQTAAAWSANITDWGTGNSYTNTLHFISTRPNSSGKSICGALPQNPYGNFKIQVASSGKYVAASSGNTNLIASATTTGTAATFNSAYIPNAGTLKLSATSQYVTADSSGSYALGAIRPTASTWERFVIRQKNGAASGVYSIKAASNGLYVTIGSDGSLLNNGATEGASAGFKFVSA